MVILASQNELGSVSSSSIFRRVWEEFGVNSFLKDW